jgi:hypothetical protein
MVSADSPVEVQAGLERRSERRYVIAATLEYAIGQGLDALAVGHGRLVNISRGGVLFESAEIISSDTEIELFVEWPVRRNKIEPIYLRILGKTIRTQGGGNGVKILSCEFPAEKTIQAEVNRGDLPGPILP